MYIGISQKIKKFDKLSQIKESAHYQDIVNDIYKTGDKYLKQPLLELPFSLFELFHKTGSRKEYEKFYFDRRGRVSTFAILSLLETDNDSYIRELENVIWAICNEYTWALPAHIDVRTSNDEIFNIEKSISLKDNTKTIIEEHKHTIDLFAAETAFALAEITSLLEGRISSLVYLRVVEEISNRVIRPYTKLSNFFHWETLPMNWAAVCSGSIGAAAIYLIEDSRLLANIIKRVLNSMEVFISGFTDDGACKEGLGYWNYGFGFYTYFAELLKDRTAGKIDIMKDDKIKEIALFQQKSYLSGDKVISFSDSPRHVKFHAGLSSRLNSLYSEFELPDIDYKAGFNDDKCYRWPHIIRDLVWYTPEVYQRDNKQSIKKYSIDYLEESQWLICKSNENEKAIVFAAKGGNNAEPHNHNDLGSFIYHVGKTTFLTDLGSGEYTKEYFGSGRYDILCNGSQGHSVPIIEGDFQQAGDRFFSNICTYDINKEVINYSIEISGAYKNNNLNYLLRKFLLNRRDNSLVIEDKYKFRCKPSSVIERLITLIKPKLIEKGKLKLVDKDSSIIIIFDDEQLKYNCTKEDHISHGGKKEIVYLLNFHFREPLEENLIKFEFKHL